MTRFNDRLAFVTGATGGIGRGIIHRLLADGARIAACGYDNPPVHEAPLPSDPKVFALGSLDVRDAAAVDRAVERAEREYGPIDFGINVAGVLTTGSIVETSDDDFRRVFEVNVFGVFHVLRALGRRMGPRQRGSIVTVTSNAAGIVRHGMGPYGASKAAAAMLTRCLGLELGQSGIRCNNVMPGSTRTGMLSSMLPSGVDVDAVVAGSPAIFKTAIPLGKLAEPDDIASMVAFLLSDDAGHITMADFYVDGGATQRA